MAKYLFVFIVHISCVALILQALNIAFTSEFGCWFAFVGKCVTFLFISTFTFQFTKERYLNEEVEPENKAVLITGCDTGFGHQLAKRLDEKGFHVFASCLFPEGKGAVDLKKTCSERLQVFGMDVANDESVANAAQYVKNNLGSSKLWAVVNNAGILKGLSVEFSSMDDFKTSMEVNAFGQVRVIKAFVPILRKNQGRVVNVTSLAGRVGFVNATPYFMSKFASVGFNECLRMELSAWKINVVSIEPEMFQTQLTNKETINKLVAASFETAPEDILKAYGKDYYEALKKEVNRFLDFSSSNTKVVVNDMVSAVCLKYPDVTYKPRRNSLFRFILYFHESMPSIVQFFFIKLIFGNSRIAELN